MENMKKLTVAGGIGLAGIILATLAGKRKTQASVEDGLEVPEFANEGIGSVDSEPTKDVEVIEE